MGVENGVALTCDLHGHSRKKNIFMYGCTVNGTDTQSNLSNSLIHMVPESVCQNCPLFSYKDCKFTCEREKETTARIVLFKEFGILNSYTLECTFYGSELFRKPEKRLVSLPSALIKEMQGLNGGDVNQYGIAEGRGDIHISEKDLVEVGKDFCRGINYSSTK